MAYYGSAERFMILSLLVCGVVVSGARGDEGQRVERILTLLQQRSDGLQDVRAQVRFVEEDKVNLTTRVKTGTVMFQMSKPNARFLISFDRTEVDGVLGKREWYLFDGRWMYEVIERLGQVTQNEIAEPGETIDLFDLETTPFPLPFGQKKESILRHFDVSIRPAQPGDPPDTDHLLCKPKTESSFSRKYDAIEFFVHRGLHLPIRIIVSKGEGFEGITADFPDLSEKSLNSGLSASHFEPPREWREKYTWVVEGRGASVESRARE